MNGAIDFISSSGQYVLDTLNAGHAYIVNNPVVSVTLTFGAALTSALIAEKVTSFVSEKVFGNVDLLDKTWFRTVAERTVVILGIGLGTVAIGSAFSLSWPAIATVFTVSALAYALFCFGREERDELKERVNSQAANHTNVVNGLNQQITNLQNQNTQAQTDVNGLRIQLNEKEIAIARLIQNKIEKTVDESLEDKEEEVDDFREVKTEENISDDEMPELETIEKQPEVDIENKPVVENETK